jgi:hypothetical protein
MVFALTAKNRTLPKQAEQDSSADLLRDFEAWLFANPSWLEDKGFGGIQAQIITSSTTFPDLEFSNPGKARGFDYWYESVSKSGDLLEDFEAWLVANPSWLEDKGFGGIQAQIITSSTTFPDLEFSNPGKARGFDYWYESTAKSANDFGQPTAPKIVAGVEGKADKLVGSDDNDVFIVNDREDKIIAGQKGTSDSVMVDFGLDLRQKKWEDIENAMLVGADDLDVVGDDGSNFLSGNGSDNVIRGGLGVDFLFGGGGDDLFVISLEKKSIDQVLDFESGEDKIALSGRTFRSLFDKNKQLKDGVIGEKLILDGDGVLWFDADGAGRKAATRVVLIGVQDGFDQTDFVYLA